MKLVSGIALAVVAIVSITSHCFDIFVMTVACCLFLFADDKLEDSMFGTEKGADNNDVDVQETN